MKKLEYRGYQFKDFFKDMIAERGFLNVDVHRLTGIAQNMISRWSQGQAIPQRHTFKVVIEAIAPTEPKERKEFLDEKLNVYESIRDTVIKTRKGEI